MNKKNDNNKTVKDLRTWAAFLKKRAPEGNFNMRTSKMTRQQIQTIKDLTTNPTD